MEITWEDLNNAAMQIILHAGDARAIIMKAIDAICEDESIEVAENYLNDAKKMVAKAHTIQTEYIQNTVQDENQKSCLLFNHAQDTLMTIQSEYLMVKNMIRLYLHLKGE